MDVRTPMPSVISEPSGFLCYPLSDLWRSHPLLLRLHGLVHELVAA